MKLKLPSSATVSLSLIAGGLAMLSTTSLGFSKPVIQGVNIVLVFLAAEGISPLTGSSFRSALHLPPVVSNLIGALLAAATVAQTQIPGMSVGAHALIQAVLTITAGLGFAPTILTSDRLANASRAAGLSQGALTLLMAAVAIPLAVVAWVLV